MSKPSITSRMEALRIDVEPDVEERHMAAMRRELREAPVAPMPVRGARRTRRRLVVTLAAAFALLLPVAALAAEDAVPGDVLYPVKQSTEWMRSLVDPGVGQQHRVRELEIVIDRGAPIEVVTDRFDASVVVVDEANPELVRRVETARETVRERYGVDLAPSQPRPGSEEPPGDTDADTGSGPGSGSGSQERNGDGAPDATSPSTTSTTSTTSPEPPPAGNGAGADEAPSNDTTTRSTVGQPEDTPEPGSGGNRP